MRVGALLLVLTIAWPAAGGAQTPAPLRKTDLIRLLTNPSLTRADVAARIRAACLAFAPTGRDRTDLVAVGADAAVMAAVSECARRATAAAPPPSPTPARPAPARPTPTPQRPAVTTPPGAQAASGAVRAMALRPQTSAPAGGQALLQIVVTRSGRPAPGVPVTLRVSGAAGAADTTPPRAVTDARGMATFRVPAGERVGVSRLVVATIGGQEVPGGPAVMLSTLPGAPAAAEVQPPRVSARTATGAAAARQAVTMTVRDAYGNAVPGEPVEFRPVSTGIGINALTGQTNSAGQFAASFPTATLRGSGEVGVFVRGQQRGSLMVLMGPVALSEARSGFVSGDGQQGTAGQPLAAPLVFEVRDSAGAPVPGEQIAFDATNGEVSPASAMTNTEGRASVLVTLGPRAGTTRVVAGAGGIRKEAVITVAPGPAVALTVQRDTTTVARTMTLQSKQPVLLRVTARDSFGNEVPVTGLRATTRNQGVLQVARAQPDGRTQQVELRPRATGSAEVEFEAAGVRETVAARVLLPVAGTGWLLAFRGGFAGFDYSWYAFPGAQGGAGPVGEVALGRGLAGGLSLAMALTVGKLKVDNAAVETPVSLMHTSVRLEYAVIPQAKVTPVVLAGGGQYQTRPSGVEGLAHHTSLFWLAGGGMDFTVRERLTFELRVSSHQLQQTKTPFINHGGHVGSLLVLTAGFRLGN